MGSRPGTGGIEAILESLDPEVELTPVIAELVEGGDSSYRGLRGARRFWDDWRIAWNFKFGDLDLREAGEKVVLVTEVSVTSQASGLDLDTPMAAIFEIRNGRIVRMTSYLDPAEGLEAAGLST